MEWRNLLRRYFSGKPANLPGRLTRRKPPTARRTEPPSANVRIVRIPHFFGPRQRVGSGTKRPPCLPVRRRPILHPRLASKSDIASDDSLKLSVSRFFQTALGRSASASAPARSDRPGGRCRGLNRTVVLG